MGFVWSAEMKYCIGGNCRTRCKEDAACQRRLIIIGHSLLILKAELPGHAPFKRPIATPIQFTDLLQPSVEALVYIEGSGISSE
jgi:hypothetical protein